MNKYYSIAIVLITGIILTEFGTWAKITHQSYAVDLLTAGLMIKAIGFCGLAWLIVMCLKKKNEK